MTDALATALVSVIPSALAAFGSLVVIIQGARNHKATEGKISELTLRVNGRLDQLLATAQNTGRVAEARDQHAREMADEERKG